jgi:uncharacterized protein YbjT (DUF2867 family)
MLGTQPILVVGGTGRTGRHVVTKLLERGRPVRVLTRHVERVRGQLDEDIEVFEGDLARVETLKAPVSGIAGVVEIVESDPGPGGANPPEQAHHQGTVNIISAARKAGPDATPHIVMVSQIYITRPEAFPEVRDTILARGRAEAALRESGLPFTIVRPSWLTNEPGGRQGLRLDQGDAGEGQIAREDVAEACIQALLSDTARGKTFEIYNKPGSPVEDWEKAFAALSADPEA